jgi:hypothetical protein
MGRGTALCVCLESSESGLKGLISAAEIGDMGLLLQVIKHFHLYLVMICACVSIPFVVIAECFYLFKICFQIMSIPFSQLTRDMVMKVLLCGLGGVALAVIGFMSVYILWSSLKYLTENAE